MRLVNLIFLALLIFSGCKQVQPDTNAQDEQVNFLEEIKQKVSNYYNEWKGTKYAYGGNSKKGVDCSALTMNFYNEILEDIKFPRTVKEQLKQGDEITQDKLEVGDLVFFKTTSRDYHVGIYYEDGSFIHSSTSKGVMISKLDNPYWKPRYIKATRVLNASNSST